MVLNKEISLDLRVKICTLREEGFSHSAIAEKVGVSKTGVSYTLNRFKNNR